MKTKIISIFFLLIFVVFSCNKEELVERPDWLSDKVNEVITDNLCDITTVSIYRFEGEYFYEIYCGIWSCVACHVYDANGENISWNNDNMLLFIENRELVKEIPACD